MVLEVTDQSMRIDSHTWVGSRATSNGSDSDVIQ